jgi:hypothetical protein
MTGSSSIFESEKGPEQNMQHFGYILSHGAACWYSQRRGREKAWPFEVEILDRTL